MESNVSPVLFSATFLFFSKKNEPRPSEALVNAVTNVNAVISWYPIYHHLDLPQPFAVRVVE